MVGFGKLWFGLRVILNFFVVDYGPHDYVQIILMHEMWVIVIVSNDLRGKDFQRIL